MQDIRGRSKKKNLRIRTTGREKQIIAVMLAVLIVLNLIPESVFAGALGNAETTEMTEVSDVSSTDEIINEKASKVENENVEITVAELTSEANETSNTDSSNEETTNKETTNEETSNKETTNTETSNEESKNEDSVNTETSNTETSNTETSKTGETTDSTSGDEQKNKNDDESTEAEQKSAAEKLAEDGAEDNSEDAEETSKEITGSEDANEEEEEDNHQTSYTDSNTAVRIEESDEGALKTVDGFSVKDVTGNMDGNAAQNILNYAGVYPSSYSIKAYDLKLFYGANEIEPSGYVTVMLPLIFYNDNYDNYLFYIFEGGSPTKINVAYEGSYACYTTSSLERLYIYGYNTDDKNTEDGEKTEEKDDKEETIKISVNAICAHDGEKCNDVGTIEIKNYSKLSPAPEINIDATISKTSKSELILVAKANTGYKFVGWYDTIDASTTCLSEETEYKITEYVDTKVYAIYTEDTSSTEEQKLPVRAYAVVNGEKNTEAGLISVPGSEIVAKPELYLKVSASEKELSFKATANDNYKFVGWYEDIEGKNLITENELLPIEKVEEKSYYAVFELVEQEEVKQVYVKAYSIVNGERSTKAGLISVPGTEVTPKSSLSLKVSTAEKSLSFEATANENYEFLGWYEDADGKNLITVEELLPVEQVEEKIYYALFEEIEVAETVNVKAYVAVKGEKNSAAGKIKIENTNYTSKSTANFDITKNEAFSLKVVDVSSNYVFVGWYDNIYGDGTPITTSETLTVSKAKAAVYYAVFEKYVTVGVNYCTNSTSKMGTIEVEGDSAVSVKRGNSFTLTAKAYEGYTFAGWYDQKSPSGVTPVSTKASLTLKLSSSYNDSSITYYAYFVSKTLAAAPEIVLTSEGIKLVTNGTTLKKAYYQLTSIDVTASEIPVKYTSWYKFTQAGIANDVVDVNGTNGYKAVGDLSNGSTIAVTVGGWYTFIFKDSEDTIYASYILVDGSEYEILTPAKTTTKTTAKTTTTTKTTTPSTNTATTTKKNTTTTKTTTKKDTEEDIVGANIDTDKVLVEATISQIVEDFEEPSMLLTYQDNVRNGEKITKFAYTYVGKEEPEEINSWYEMGKNGRTLTLIRDVKVNINDEGRTFQFPVDKDGYYYICVSNEESGEQYYTAYLSEEAQINDNFELSVENVGGYVTASLGEEQVCFIRADEDEFYKKGNRIKLTEEGYHDIFVINQYGEIYSTQIEIQESIIDKSNLSKYVTMLQELVESVTPLSQSEYESVTADGRYCTEETFYETEDARYEGALILEDLYVEQYDIDFETNKVMKAYETLKNEIIFNDNQLVKVENGNDIVFTARSGEYFTYIVYPVDEKGRLASGMWTTYAGLTSGEYVRLTDFEDDTLVTFENVQPGVYSFAIRTGGKVEYRNVVVCESGYNEIESIEIMLEADEGLFDKAQSLLKETSKDTVIYSKLKNELSLTYDAYDNYTNDGQVQLLINQAAKLNNLLVKTQRIVEDKNKEDYNYDSNVNKQLEDSVTPGISITENL